MDGILRVGIMKFLALFAASGIQCLCDSIRMRECGLLQRMRCPREAHRQNGRNWGVKLRDKVVRGGLKLFKPGV